MKRIFIFLSMVVFAIGMMSAQWVPSDTESTQLDKEGAEGQVQMKTVRTDDGKIILSWLRPEMNDNVFSYELHLQLFDANGVAQFGDEGIIVCNKPTRTWTTDYGMALADNGDILLAYTDVRNDPVNMEETEVYIYRYNQAGEPVWDVDGVRFPSWNFHANTFSFEDQNPAICVNGDNIYVGIVRIEYFGGSQSVWELVRLNDDGSAVPGAQKVFYSKTLAMQPSIDGSVFCVYENADLGYDAERLDENLDNIWGSPITVENRPISNGRFVPTPITEVDNDGGMFLTYRVLNGFTGFQVINHLTPDGPSIDEAVSCNNSEDGDAGSAVIAVKEDKVFTGWEWEYDAYYMYANVIDALGNFCWPDNKMYGFPLERNSTWGFVPVKAIPRKNGWILLYGNLQTWNGANFMVVKFDEAGEIVSSKQIREDNCKASGFSVVYDENYAYIFYTQEIQYDDQWNEIPGTAGMFVMCVDISDEVPSGMNEVEVGQPVSTEVFTIDGKRVTEMTHGIYIIRNTDANGNVTTLKVRM